MKTTVFTQRAAVAVACVLAVFSSGVFAQESYDQTYGRSDVQTVAPEVAVTVAYSEQVQTPVLSQTPSESSTPVNYANSTQGRAPVVSSPTHIQGCDPGLVSYAGTYYCTTNLPPNVVVVTQPDGTKIGIYVPPPPPPPAPVVTVVTGSPCLFDCGPYIPTTPVVDPGCAVNCGSSGGGSTTQVVVVDPGCTVNCGTVVVVDPGCTVNCGPIIPQVSTPPVPVALDTHIECLGGSCYPVPGNISVIVDMIANTEGADWNKYYPQINVSPDGSIQVGGGSGGGGGGSTQTSSGIILDWMQPYFQ